VFSSHPNPDRPTVPAAVAAEILDCSRYYVSELIRQGELDGFGIRKEDSARTRWYVFKDSLPGESGIKITDATVDAQELRSYVEEAYDLARRGRDARRTAEVTSLYVVKVMHAAVRAARKGDAELMSDLLMEVHERRSDESQCRLSAEGFDDKLEAALGEARRIVSSGPGAVDSSVKAQADRGDSADVMI
jgi:hypothetical protein